VESYTHFNKRTPETQITNETKTTHLANPATMKSAWCCPSERHPTPSLLLRGFHCLQRHTRVERSKYEFSKTVPMGDAANRQSQQAHLIHGGIDRGSPQSTLNSPTSGALHTLQQRETRKHQTTNETKTTHFSNSATTKSAWCCPSARHPAPSLPRRRFDCLQTHPSGEIQIRIQQNSSMGDAVGKVIETIAATALDTWWY
jgi:hypothetical protein